MTMNKKELPIVLDSDIKMECWTYYKMAIIQTLPNYMNWVSSHISIYYDEVWNSMYFGEGPTPHNSEYFRDILDIEEVDLFCVSANDIIEKIKTAINEDYYYVVYLRDENNISHEIFIYGYNDVSSEFSALTYEYKKGFGPNVISYKKVEDGYRFETNFFKEHVDMYYYRRHFGYVMAKIKPVERYQSKNYAFDFFDKINREVYGTKVDVSDNCCIDDFTRTHGYYTGTACMHIIKNKLIELKNAEIKEKSRLISVTKNNLFKLLEHKNIIAKSMEWQELNWNICDDSIIEEKNKYKTCCNTMANICYMFLKFQQTNNYNLLDKIIRKIEALHHEEKNILDTYVSLMRNWYYKMIEKKFC